LSVECVVFMSHHICADLRSSVKAETVRQALLTKTLICARLMSIQPPNYNPCPTKRPRATGGT
ncbi:hypothetical protein GGX14DRAFT_366303, partial [Mycena pura]